MDYLCTGIVLVDHITLMSPYLTNLSSGIVDLIAIDTSMNQQNFSSLSQRNLINQLNTVYI